MKKQKQYFINGLILIIVALMAVTIVPYCTDRFRLFIEKNVLCEFEFFTLCASALFYLFSPKYYKGQIISILSAYLYYFAFVKLYPYI